MSKSTTQNNGFEPYVTPALGAYKSMSVTMMGSGARCGQAVLDAMVRLGSRYDVLVNRSTKEVALSFSDSGAIEFRPNHYLRGAFQVMKGLGLTGKIPVRVEGNMLIIGGEQSA